MDNNINWSSRVQEDDNTPKNDSNKNWSYLKDISRKCARKNLSWDKNSDSVKNIDFYNKIYTNNAFNNENFNSEKFFNSLTSWIEWWELEKLHLLSAQDREKLYNEDFKLEIEKISFKYERKKDELNKIINNKYKLNDKQKKDLLTKISKLNSEELDNYIFHSEESEKFVKSVAKDVSEPEQIIEIKKLLKNFSFSSLEEFREKIKKETEINPSIWTENVVFVSLKTILNKSKVWESIDSIDIRDIFSYGIFDESQKKQFLTVFLPSITLNELLKLEIIDKKEAIRIKKEEIIKEIKRKKNIEEVDEKELTEIEKYLDYKDIFISTERFLEKNYIDLLDSDLFKNEVAKSLNKTNEEIKEKNLASFQTLEILKHKLIENRSVLHKLKWWKEDLDKFIVWNVFRFKIDKDEDNLFYELSDLWDNWEYKWKNRSVWWNYNSSSNVTEQSPTPKYKDLYELLTSEKIKEVEILSKDDIKSKIESWKLKEVKDELWEPWKLQLQKYTTELKSKLEKLKEVKSEEELEKDLEYIELKNKIKELEEENALESESVKEYLNLHLLNEKIDEIDKEWIDYRLEPWVSFKVDDWEDKELRVYTITHINNANKTIQIINPFWKEETATFDEFYKSFYSHKWKIKRFTKNFEIEWLVNSIWNNVDLYEVWKEYEVKDWKLLKKEQENITYPYLVQDISKTWNASEMIQIHDVMWTWINQKIWITLWKVTQEDVETGENDDKWKPKTIKRDIYNLENNIHYVSLAFLENYIKENKLKPKTQEKEIQNHNIKPTENPKWGFFKWFLSNKSFHEIMKWLKMWFTEFQNHLKWWTEEHAAKVALTTWWKFLPMEVKMELTARVEAAEKKHMDDYVSRLETMDSWQAVTLIDKRLKYNNTEEYKKEAWMVFMLKKYGSLYNKNPLNKKKWQFLWFKALTWDRGDVTKHPLYQEVKSACEKEKRNFTEEELVWMLMKKQCSEHGYMWKHRRSRLHKEIEKFKKQWLADELADWEKKAWETRNPDEQLRKWISEFVDWSPWNWVWRFKKLIDRWTSMENYNQIPFMLICSWTWRSYADYLSNEIKNIIDAKRPVLLARYMSYPADMDLAKETLQILAHKINKYNPTLYPDIAKDIDELYKYTNSSDPKVFEWDKIKACNEFYKKVNKKTWRTYGDILTRAMYGLADWNKKDWDDINSIIVADKDKPGSDNLVLKTFYDKMMWYSFSNNYWDDDYMSDSFLQVWTSSFWPNVVKTVIKQESWGWFRMVKSWPKMVDEVKKEIEATKNRNYSVEENRNLRLKHYLKLIFAWIAEAHQTKLSAANDLFTWVWALKFFNEKRGINFDKFVKYQLWYDDIMSWNQKSERVFDEFVDNILKDKKPMDVSTNVFNLINDNYADDYDIAKAA